MPGDRAKVVSAVAAVAAAAAAYYIYQRRKRSESKGLVLRSAYQPSPYQIETVNLNFILTEEEAVVKSVLKFAAPSCATTPPPLYLDGEELELRSITMDGKVLSAGRDYVLGAEEGLTVLAPPATSFELAIVVAIKPQDNTQLSGLYKTSGNYCTQCEAVGFRRITYFLDRPDVMSKYKVRVEADKALYPVLLSNGNETARGELAGGRHYASFEDPFKKPSYLFALVAANLKVIKSSFTTCSKREVQLAIWSEPENVDQLDWAMQCLKDAMAWDERTFGREYDLDVYHIIAVNDFNVSCRPRPAPPASGIVHRGSLHCPLPASCCQPRAPATDASARPCARLCHSCADGRDGEQGPERLQHLVRAREAVNGDRRRL